MTAQLKVAVSVSSSEEPAVPVAPSELGMAVVCAEAVAAVVEALEARAENYNRMREQVFDLEASGDAMVFVPDHMPVSNGERSVAKLAASHELGLAQARREMPAIREFLGL